MCNGQILSIAQNTALFSLIGTTFGGNGQTTFALPDLESRVALGAGQGPGLASYDLGQVAGTESITLTTNNMPSHTHSGAQSSSTNASTVLANGNFPAKSARKVYSTAGGNTAMSSSAGTVAGGSQPHNNIQPYLAINFCIALEGIFPSRN